MTMNEADLKLKELKRALQIYNYVYRREDSMFYADALVNKMIKKVQTDIDRLETALSDGELDDSFFLGSLYERD